MTSKFLLSFFLLLSTLPSLGMAQHESFFRAHCIDCHGPDVQEAGLRLDKLPGELDNSDSIAGWVTVFDRVNKGEMPPKDAPQPSNAERAAFIDSLRNRLVEAERQQLARNGNGAVRRMNRTEYEHTLQDLLSLPLLRVKEMLPEDGQQYGFDKVPGALDISHVQMQKYLRTADIALRQAIVRETKAPETRVWRESAVSQNSGRAAIATHNAAPVTAGKLAPGLTTKIMGNPVDDPGNSYRAAQFSGDAESLVIFSGVLGAHQPQGIQPDRFQPTLGGWYKVRFSTWGLCWDRDHVQPAVRSVIRKHVELGPPIMPDKDERWKYSPLEKPQVREYPENTEFYGDAEVVHVVRASLKGKVLGFFDAPSLKPTVHEFKVWLEPGERISFHVMSLPERGPMNSGSSNGVRSYEGPGVAYDWFEIEGPLTEQWPPASQRRLFGETPLGSFPRPLLPDVPIVAAAETVQLPIDSLTGVGQKVGDLWYLNLQGSVSTQLNFATPGKHQIKVKASQTAAGDEAAVMRLLLNGVPIPHGQFKVEVPQSESKFYSQTFEISSAGPATLGIEFLNDYFDENTKADRNLLLEAIEITGPEQTSGASTEPLEVPDLRKLLHRFAEQAFRRPVDVQEIEPYAEIVEAQLQQGQSFEESMIAGYKGLLCSPDFLFIGLEGDYALASRLSYFLWDSLPDNELLNLAATGKLSQDEVLTRQVDRMLADRRSDRFVEHFLDEWLEMKKIDFTTPDEQLYPEFDPWLRDSMLAETRLYFRKLISENLNIDHLIHADFVLVNQRLAEHYGIRGVAGSEFREVKVPEDLYRGGFLTQAAVLKVTANGTATSPVLRGVWVTERILGIPRRPPPPNIPAVEPDASGAVTIRQQIEKHRADPACASCHRVMDPPGMALESFDVIGGWRENYRAGGRPKTVGKGKDRMLEPHLNVLTSGGDHKPIRLGGEVDSSGQLTDGREFENIRGLKNLLLADREQLAGNLARQLTIYATGKGYRFSDRSAISSVVEEIKSSDYAVRSMIKSVVCSPLFKESL